MKLTVKTLKGTHFEIRVQPNDTIMAVKKNIEAVQGKEFYPCGQQLLIHNGKVLKDETTLEENKVSEDGFLVVMLSRSKGSSSSGASSAQPLTTPAATPATPATPPTAPEEAPQQAPAATPAAPPTAPEEAPQQAPATLSLATETERPRADVSADAYDQAASSLVAGGDLEKLINQLMEMGGGNWDRDTVVRALRAAYNNPERAVDYLYSGIPTTAEVAVPVGAFPASQTSSVPRTSATDAAAQGATPLSALPNSSPLDMFPQGASSLGMGASGGTLDFLRNNPQFQALRAMVQANPQILQPMLQELSKQNPQLLRLIQEHNDEFLQLINEAGEGVEGDLFDQPDQDDDLPHAITVTREEEEAIARLEAMGFDRGRVIEAFLACDRNEQLAANYLLEHEGDED